MPDNQQEKTKNHRGMFANQQSEMRNADSLDSSFCDPDSNYRGPDGRFTIAYGIAYDCYDKLEHRGYYVPCRKHDLYGVCESHSKTLVLPPVFDDVAFMYDESGALIERTVNVKVDDEWHLYRLGEGFIENPVFKVIGRLHAGVRHASYIKKLHGFIDTAGRIVLPFIYADCKSFSEGLAAVKWIAENEMQNTGWGYIDREGNRVIHGRYADACKFHHGYARVKDEDESYGRSFFSYRSTHNDNWGIIDKQGNSIIPCTNDLSVIYTLLDVLRRHPTAATRKDTPEKYVADKSKIAIARNFVMVVNADRRVTILDQNGHLLDYSHEGIIAMTWHDIKAVAAGFDHGMAIDESGAVLSTGNTKEFSYGYEIHHWKNISQLDACEGHSAAITADGRILIVTEKGGYETPKDYTKEITSIPNPRRLAVGWLHGAVLLQDGRVKAVGENWCNSCNVSHWENVVDIDVFGCYFSPTQTVGLTGDGHVLHTNDYDEPQSWKDIVSVSCGDAFLVALDKNGKLHACGRNDCGQCDVEGWPKMICAKGDFFTTVGIDEEGWIWMTPGGKTKFRVFGS